MSGFFPVWYKYKKGHIFLKSCGSRMFHLEPDGQPYIDGSCNWMMVPKSLRMENGWKSPKIASFASFILLLQQFASHTGWPYQSSSVAKNLRNFSALFGAPDRVSPLLRASPRHLQCKPSCSNLSRYPWSFIQRLGCLKG